MHFLRRFQNRSLLGIQFTAPVLTLLFAMIYGGENVNDIGVALLDQDRSNLSGTLSRMAEATPALSINYRTESQAEIINLFQEGKINGAIVIPHNFEKDIKSSKQTNVGILLNSANLITSNYIYNDAVKTVKTLGAGILINKYQSAGIQKEIAKRLIQPVITDTAPLYNPGYSYLQYLVLPLTLFLHFMGIMLSAAGTISAGELKNAGHKEIIEMFFMQAAGNLVSITVSLLIILPLFNLKIATSSPEILIVFILFIIVSQLIGFGIAVNSSSKMMATEIVLFYITPAFIFSGVTFPLWAMPGVFQYYAEIIPYTHLLSVYLKIHIMGAGMDEVMTEINKLLLGGVIGITAILLRCNCLKSLFETLKHRKSNA
ncbi:MAG: ABC transporter permease [Ignavibacteriales bacterium]|nr:ABC transporter permease [Ignavibacteriales bacterium]MCF8438679.1 ABC transporter permease [Ignavibacteriales bacterium]